LTTEENSPILKHTTYKQDYIKINTYDPNDEPKGIRYKLTEEAIRRQLIEEAENNQMNKYGYTDEPIDYTSEAKDRYAVPGFVHRPPQPTAVISTKFINKLIYLKLKFYFSIKKHDLYAEMPISYWTEHKNKAHVI